ncbi:MAG TPA: amino acid adenylation domain-containing protein, partial [Rugosimonospora sp.]|nr:amino acid adenylation domain-containing protein [Rugosimonospora sp.]
MTEREVADLVESLAGLGVRLWVEEGQLRFRAPRGVLTDEWRGRLRDSRDGLLAHLGADPAARDFAPDPAGRYEPFPVTDVQAAYLLGRGSGFAYGGTGCHGYGELTYPSLDPDRLATAWRALIERHDMLRAVIEVDGSQRVLPEVPQLRIVTADLRGRTPEEVDAALAATRAEMDHRVFAPDRWPLFEVRLTLTDTRAVQHVSVDFLIADFVSIQIVLDELHRLYHRPDEPVPPLALTFRDYLQAERSRQAGTRREADRGYWLGRLAELPPAPALPVGDHPRAGEPVRFRRFETRLDTTTWAGLRKRAGQHGVTASGAVLAAYAEVVAAWSRQPRFTLDITLLNRLPLHPQVDRLVGDFTGVDLLAVDADPARPFVERARDLQAQLWQDLDHRAFTGVEVIREIARRDGGDAALFPIVFTSAIGLAEAGGAADGAPVGELGYGISQTPQVWIDCQNIERQGCLATNWDVREGVFPAGLVEDMFDAYRSLLSRLATGDEPWTSTGPVPLPEAQARRRREVNDTAAPVSAGLLHDGVVAQALRTPGRVAVIGPDRTLTYGELLGRAVALADRLGPVDGLVGVVMDKGWEQVVAVLGILLAGGAYLPVELSQPPLRRRQILAAAGVDRLVSTARVVARGDCPDTALVLDDLVAEPRPVPARAEPDALAYTIFTSGSTGTPKGVMISHRSALNTVVDMNSRFGIGADDRVLGLSSLGFDLSVYDIFGPLATGGCLVLPDPDRRGDPSHWADLAARHGVTVWNSVPAQLQMLHDYLSVTPALALPALRLALLSGDWIPVALPDQIRRQAVGGAAGPRLVSLGGATEAAIWSIYYPIAEVPGDWRSIPYGRPLANQTFHVLGPAMRPCPDWVPGELYIGGTGVALGYLGDAARTAERFVTHPGTGERLYRTGDLGRYLPSGDIEFLGREDFQVKIRGYRIELAEVESALGSHPGVGAAAVVVDGDRPLERRLVGFVEPAPRTEADPAVLPRGDVGGARLRQNPAPAVLPREQVRGMTAAALAAGEAEVAGVDRDRYLAFAHRLDGVALPAMVDTLRRAGLFPDGAASHTEADIQSAAGVA